MSSPVWNMTDKRRELAAVIGEKESDRDWFKLFAYGVDRERNWVGLILKEEYVNVGNVQDHEFEAGQILM